MYPVLKQCLERVVVNVFVDIESCKDVKRVAKVDISWNGCITLEDREEMHRADDRVDVHDRHDSIPVIVDIGLYDPHAVVGVRFVERLGKVVNQRTGE